MSAQLDSFVRDCLARGIRRAMVRKKLRAAGGPAGEIEAALAEYAGVEFLPWPIHPQPPVAPRR
jgi:hypothetical protein